MPDPQHAAVELDGELAVQLNFLRAHLTGPPAIASSALKRTAKSFFSSPRARAEVSSSLVSVVAGSGTLELRPSSRARSMSFCIMFTSNHASSGMFSTNGPRYLTIGEAVTALRLTRNEG